MRISVDIAGDKSILKGLEMEAEQEISDEIAATALDISDAAKGDAPVDTGNLKNSIVSDTEHLEGQVEAQAKYAAFVEYGTYKMSAQPYLIPNFHKETRKMLDRLKRRGWK